MIYEDIKNFFGQFAWKPEIVNDDGERFRKFLAVGMGGSNLAADLVRILRPDLDIAVHRDYGLPEYLEADRLVLLCSHSGNTEEVIDAYNEAGKRNFKRMAIGAGGKLLELAEKDKTPYLRFPENKIQPRVALGFSFLALLKAIGDEKLLEASSLLAKTLKPADSEENGKKLAEGLRGFVPVIYASNRNKGLSYVWKVIFNETAKIPAFANVFPELNHNEMTGFDFNGETKPMNEKLAFIFLEDGADYSRITKRATVTIKLMSGKRFKVEKVVLTGSSPVEKIFNSIILAHFTAYHLALNYGVEPEAVPMVEDFKKLIG